MALDDCSLLFASWAVLRQVASQAAICSLSSAGNYESVPEDFEDGDGREYRCILKILIVASRLGKVRNLF